MRLKSRNPQKANPKRPEKDDTQARAIKRLLETPLDQLKTRVVGGVQLGLTEKCLAISRIGSPCSTLAKTRSGKSMDYALTIKKIP